MTYSRLNTIKVVARREIIQCLRSRGVMVTLVLFLILLVAGVYGGAYLLNSDKESSPVIEAVGFDTSAIAADASALPYRLEQAGTVDAAKEAILNDDAAGAVALDEDTVTVFYKGSTSPVVEGYLSAIQQRLVLDKTLNKVGVDQGELSAAAAGISAESVDVGDAQDNTRDSRIFVVMIGIFILVLSIYLFSANVGSRVTEEKASRIVELIVAAVKPLDFLTGKILGNVVFGVVAILILLGASTVALFQSGLADLIDFDLSVLPALIVASLLGIVFFSSMYAAAGSMVRRVVDLQSTQMPIILLVFATLYLPVMFSNHLDSIWMRVLAWIPPFSIGTAPLQYAAGNMSALAFTGAMLLMLLFTILTVIMVSQIYRKFIIFNGAKVTWRQALSFRQ